MIRTEIPLPFVFYTDRSRQHRFRKNCAGQIMDGLLAPNDSLLPFQIRVSSLTAPTITSWELFSVCGQVMTGGEIITDELGNPITDELGNPLTTEYVLGTGGVDYNLTSQAGLISILSHNGGYNLIYNGGGLSSILACGFYESKIVLSTGETLWSEVFHVVEFSRLNMPYLRLCWKNPCGLQNIAYPVGYRNEVYFDSFISNSEPEVIEEVEKDGIDMEIMIFSKIVNKLRFSEVVPDYLKTAIMAMKVHKEIFIKEEGLSEIAVSRAIIAPSIEGGGCFSFVDILLEVDNVLYNSACC